MINIQISEEYKDQIKSALIHQTALSTLAYLSVHETSTLTVLVTTEHDIQALNQKFRNVDAPTDVLAFPAGHLDPEDGTTYLGDVVISYSQATLQAEQGGYSVNDEIQLLVIHGTLHLLGYDHGEPEEKQKMWAVQGKILEQLGIGPHILDDD